MSRKQLIDIECEVVVDLPLAYKIYDGKTTDWVPKSQVEMEPKGDGWVCTMPISLAKEKGFI